MAINKKAPMKKQSAASRLDERLSMMHGKESGKKQSFASRRHESKGASKGKKMSKKGCM